ncbi:hypothetical protein GCM10022221_48260 [Actinocorallia aurea]
MDQPYDYRADKAVVVLASTLSAGVALNVTGHLCASLGAHADRDLMGRRWLVDADGVRHAGRPVRRACCVRAGAWRPRGRPWCCRGRPDRPAAVRDLCVKGCALVLATPADDLWHGDVEEGLGRRSAPPRRHCPRHHQRHARQLCRESGVSRPTVDPDVRWASRHLVCVSECIRSAAVAGRMAAAGR